MVPKLSLNKAMEINKMVLKIVKAIECLWLEKDFLIPIRTGINKKYNINMLDIEDFKKN